MAKRLPSYQSAIDFIEKPGFVTAMGVFGSWAGRSIIVAAGMGLAGKGLKDSVFNGMIAASAIEVFVLGHAVTEAIATPSPPAEPPT